MKELDIEGVYVPPEDMDYLYKREACAILYQQNGETMEKLLYDIFDTIRFSDLVLEDKEANDLEKKVVEAPTQDKDSNTSSTTRYRVNNFCNEDNTPTRDKESKTPTQDKELHVTKVRSPEEVSYWINFGHFPDK